LKAARRASYFCGAIIKSMSRNKIPAQEESPNPFNFYRHLPFPLPIVQAKKKKKCCKKYKKGKRCKSCPNG